MKYIILIILSYASITLCNAQKLRNEFSYSSKIDYGEQVVFWNRRDTTVNRYEKVVINGFDSKVPLFHFIDKDNKNKFVFLLHGIGSSKDDWLRPRSDGKLVDSLVSLGYDVIIPDAKYHGERSYEFNFRPAYTLPRGISNGKSQEDANSLCKVYTGTIKDMRIIMDYLEKKYNSTDLQFDFIGYSMGGAMSLIINAIDNRVNSVVACVPPVNRPLEEIKGFDWPIEIIDSLKDVTPKFYSQFLNAPSSLLMGRTDSNTSEQVVKEFYDDLPLKDKNLKFYEAGHSLPPEYINDVIEWITTHNNK